MGERAGTDHSLCTVKLSGIIILYLQMGFVVLLKNVKFIFVCKKAVP